MTLQLKKQLGLIDGISYVAGAIIGSGIFISPSPVLAGSGGSTVLALVIWGACGIVVMAEALCFMELVQRVRKSGGVYTFILEAFGESVSFVFLWMHILILKPMSMALGALASATYLLRIFFPHCSHLAPGPAVKLIGTLLIMLYIFINCYSIKRSAVLQAVILTCKLVAIGLIVIFGLIHISKGTEEQHLTEPFDVEKVTASGILFAVYVGVFAYGGGNIPLAIIIGHVIPIVAYLLVNVAYYSVLTTEQITSGLAVAVTFAEQCMGFLKWAIVACIVLSTSASINHNCFSTSRMIYVSSREGNLPRFLSMVNVTRRSLLPAMITLGLISIVILSLMSLLSTLKIYTFLMQATRLVAVCGLFKLRKTHNPINVIKLPIFIPVFYILMMTSLMVLTVIYDPGVITRVILFASTGVLAVVLTKFGESDDNALRNVYNKMHDPMVKFCRAVLLSDFADTSKVDKSCNTVN